MLHVVVHENILDAIFNKKRLNVRSLLKSRAKDLMDSSLYKFAFQTKINYFVPLCWGFSKLTCIRFSQIFVYLLLGCFRSKLHRFLICAVVNLVVHRNVVRFYTTGVMDVLQTFCKQLKTMKSMKCTYAFSYNKSKNSFFYIHHAWATVHIKNCCNLDKKRPS